MTPEQRLEGVRALFAPRNIAIVGASDRPGNWSQRVYRSLRRFDFPGDRETIRRRATVGALHLVRRLVTELAQTRHG